MEEINNKEYRIVYCGKKHFHLQSTQAITYINKHKHNKNALQGYGYNPRCVF